MKPQPALAWLSPIYLAGHALRLWTYRSGLRATERLTVPVISVGNLTTGGTGKSPIVAEVARILADAGYRPGIASRGYGREVESNDVIIAYQPAESALCDARIVGDEPALLASLVPGIPIAVHAKRAVAGRALIAKHNCNVVILDDGFQHVQLARDCDIVLLDATRDLASERPLPAGHLRESVSVLARAHVILHTRAATLSDVPDANRSAASQHASHAPQVCVSMSTDTTRLWPACTEAIPPGARVLMAAGIGNPTALKRELKNQGFQVVTFPLPDHAKFDVAQRQAISDAAKQHDCAVIVMTAKDAVKLPADWQPSVPVAIATQSVRFDQPDAFREIILRAAQTANPSAT